MATNQHSIARARRHLSLATFALSFGIASPAFAYNYQICALATALCSPVNNQPSATAAYVQYQRTFCCSTTTANVVVTSDRRGCSTHRIERTDRIGLYNWAWDKRFVAITHPNGCTP